MGAASTLPGSRETLAEDACLYVGRVMHHRLQPKRHRFVYRVFTLLLDIDRLAELDQRLRLFSIERANLFSFHAKDHGPRNGEPLRPWVESELRRASIADEPVSIRLLAMPRLLGYAFNPLSIYYCFDADERLFAVVYEVKNTFGEQHTYVLPVDEAQTSAQVVHQQCDKDFYVSPFIEAEATYRFKLNIPNGRLNIVIREEIESGPLLLASLIGHRRALTDLELVRQTLLHPFLTQKVIASIHIQAFKLWLKGIRLQPQVKEPNTAGSFSARTPTASLVGEPPGSA
ncbi:MAG: DUF1365 domain-containing protein [Geminicoccaceae bacterium]